MWTVWANPRDLLSFWIRFPPYARLAGLVLSLSVGWLDTFFLTKFTGHAVSMCWFCRFFILDPNVLHEVPSSASDGQLVSSIDMATKPVHKSWAGLVIQQQSMQGSSGPGSIASEKSCDTVAGAAARQQATEGEATVGNGTQGKQDMVVAEETPPPQRTKPVQTAEGTSASPLVPKEQICFDFTKGQCRRGAGCKFSHDVAHIIRVNSQEKGICFDFLKGTCARGVMCRFSHDLNNLKEQGGVAGGGVNVVHPKRPTNVPICYDFVKNKCTKGDACRYSHDYSNIMSRVSGNRRGNGNRGGSVTPSRGGMMQSHVIGAVSRTPERPQSMSPVQQTCIDYLRGNCPRGPFCDMAHRLPSGHQGQPGSHEQPESLESLIGRLKKIQYEHSMVVENTRMLASPHHGLSSASNSPLSQHQGQFAHQTNQANQMQGFQGTFSYPPPTSMYSDGARLMSSHWSGRHVPGGSFEDGNPHEGGFSGMGAMSSMYPMSPPVTHAEKAKFSARIQMLQQQGIGGHELKQFGGMDAANATECGSPMISAGWQTSNPTAPSSMDLHVDLGVSQLGEPNAADELINMMTMRTIWPEEQE